MPLHLILAVREGNVMKFYKSKEWLSLRLKIIARYNHECYHCKLEGKVGRPQYVHHIKHLKDYPELGLEESNLMPLCFHHHEQQHPERLKEPFEPDASKRPKDFKERW